jgi:ABC-type lipoprotein export system ATPase subunit
LAFRAIGSTWGRWDLHFHTPSSFDYQNKAISNMELVNVLRKAGISVVAITDHHVMDVLRLKELQKFGKDDLTVLPGIEFRTELGGKEKVHLIGIFSEEANLDDLWTKLSGKLGLTSEDVKKKGGDEAIYVNFKEAAQVIRELGGIVTTHAGGKSNSIESIGNASFKMALKTDLALNYVDVFELGKPSDRDTYQQMVFPKIKHELPLIMGSDNHDITKYKPKAACWIKGDPSFRTFQQLKSDPHRAWIGDEPPELTRMRENPTKYVESVSFQKNATSKLNEDWFGGEIPVNPGLVAIIGNKGSGKTALAETIGLLGNCGSSHAFSFLSERKFCQPKNNKARDFKATLTWRNGHKVTKGLSDPIDPNAPSDISYIPQSYLEEICNEVNNVPGSRFDAELKSVIFSHVAEDRKLDADSLDDLIAFQAEPIEERLITLRAELSEINTRILGLESRSTAGNRQLLLNLKASKERELEAHDKAKPEEVLKPETNPAQQAEMEAIGKRITTANEQRATFSGEIKSAEALKKTASAQIASATRVSQLLKNFSAAHRALLVSLAADCKVLGIDPTSLVSVTIDTAKVTTVSSAADKVLSDQDAAIAATNTHLESLKTTVNMLTEQLDAPNSAHQKYVEALHVWTERRKEILGSADIRDSISFIDGQIKELDGLPTLLKTERDTRDRKVKEIFDQIQATVEIYRTLYRPVQEFILSHKVATQQFHLEFDASIIAVRLEDDILGKVNQGRKGTFCGSDDGKRLLKELVDQADLQTANGVAQFCSDLLLRFQSDYRVNPPAACSFTDQLKQAVQPVDMLDTIFGLSYLVPKYQLKWAGKSIDELSPGERGTLLLIFYLLIDRRDIPLIIDQPEDNLDNQTVYDMLVDCLREARKRRQVIIVTHNPNLAVVCDADQIIHSHMDKQGRNKVTYTPGSIENPVTNNFSITVLEGTRPAFTHRDRKYQREPGTEVLESIDS